MQTLDLVCSNFQVTPGLRAIVIIQFISQRTNISVRRYTLKQTLRMFIIIGPIECFTSFAVRHKQRID